MRSLPQSLWMEEALTAPSTPSLQLHGDQRVDVAIIGGGYVGLWTAIELKRRDRNIRVAVLEAGFCGVGASGRNGGYALSWWPKAGSLTRQFGSDAARELLQRSESAILDLHRFCDAEAREAQFQRVGWVWGADSDSLVGSWDEAVEACTRLGVGSFTALDRAAVSQCSGTAVFRAGVLDRTAALLHPGYLVRSVREYAIRQGVLLYEDTLVRSFTRTCPSELLCATGRLKADNVVIATNAWAAGVPELARAIVVVSSDMIATAPMPSDLLAVNWKNGAGVNGALTLVDYVRTTTSGRVLAGKGGLATALGGRLSRSMFASARRSGVVLENFRRLYPQFASAAIDRFWSGPVDRTADGLPALGRLPRCPNIAFGIGWSGNGLGPSRIGAQILASLVMNTRDEWTELPIVGGVRKALPAEPWRYLGSHIVRRAVRSLDASALANREPHAAIAAVASLAPKGVED